MVRAAPDWRVWTLRDMRCDRFCMELGSQLATASHYISRFGAAVLSFVRMFFFFQAEDGIRDRKSTRLNSSPSQISYAVFCLKKKKSRRVIFVGRVCWHLSENLRLPSGLRDHETPVHPHGSLHPEVRQLPESLLHR